MRSVEGTPLCVTATTPTDGYEVIEAVERTDKAFALGTQFHLDAAVVKWLDGAEDANDYTDYDTALSFFKRVIDVATDDAQQAAAQCLTCPEVCSECR